MFEGVHRRKSSGGNVLFLILIAAALFAALSYVVVQSTRTGGSSAENEKTRLEATRYLNHVNQLRVATTRVVAAGTATADVLLHQPGVDTAVCNSGKECIFGVQGGGALDMDLPANFDLDVDGNVWHYHEIADNVTALEVGTTAPDIVVSRRFKINPQGARMCSAINKMLLGNENIPLIDGSNAGDATFPASPKQPAGCAQHFADYYVFYAVLYEL